MAVDSGCRWAVDCGCWLMVRLKNCDWYQHIVVRLAQSVHIVVRLAQSYVEGLEKYDQEVVNKQYLSHS